MKRRQEIAAIVLLLLAVLCLYGFWRTRRPLPSVAESGGKAPAPEKALVDQTPLQTAQQLAKLATTHDERVLAQEALRLADFDVDRAFDNALRHARLHPPPLSPEAKAAQAQLEKAEALLQDDQARVKQLTAQSASASQTKKDSVQADLVQAQADVELAQDEVNDAKEDLMRSGGDLIDRIQALKNQHEETTHGAASPIPTGPEPTEELGMVHRFLQWRLLHQKQMQLWQAKSETESAIAALNVKHNTLDAQVDAEKAAIPQLAQHSKSTNSDSANSPSQAATTTQDTKSDLLKKTQQLATNQKILAAYDQRIETKKQLADVYAQWLDVVRGLQRQVVHRALVGIIIILAILLIGLYFSSWIDSLLKRFSMDRRQLQTLRTVSRVSVQILAIFMILLVIFGPPGQLGTFLGLAGAGLTVALKDFIVGFLGWFVLMGKHGMHIGDWVEINGVTGEVVEITPLHTVLLETGNWTDSGHPTGRRVTFTNSFATEGHYFNFSTTGQWLWDELTVVLPAGKESFTLIDAIHKKVADATHESARQAQQEWRSAANSREMGNFSVEPALSVKPVLGGIEVAVRYITRANERYQLRSQLNQAAVELLGGKGTPVS